MNFMAKFGSRKFWVALIGQVTALIILFAGEEHADSITQASQNIGALLLMGLSGFGYIQGQGQVDAEIERQRGQNENAKIYKEPTPQQTTDSNTLNALGMVALLGISIGAGCAASPVDRWHMQRDALNAANRVFLAHQRVMTDEQIVDYGLRLQDARNALDLAQTFLPDGGPTFENYLTILEQVLIDLAEREFPDEPRGDTGGDPDQPGAVRPGTDTIQRPERRGGADRGPKAAHHRRGRIERWAGGRCGGSGKATHRIAGPCGRFLKSA